MSDAEITCCFSGHRNAGLPWKGNTSDPRCVALRRAISEKLNEIYNAGYRHFISGMALGCDTYFALAVLQLRAEHDDVILEAAVPCRNQSYRWSKAQKAEYEDILSQCDTVTILQEYYTPNCMNRRNEYMVEKSSLLLACFDGIPSGTMNTILYAKRKDIPTIIIDLDDFAEAEGNGNEE